MSGTGFRLTCVAAAVLASVIVFPMTMRVHARATTAVIASGLFNPRGLAFGPEGALYVAEAGRGGSGPCVTGNTGTVCYGASGAITRIDPLVARVHGPRSVGSMHALHASARPPVSGGTTSRGRRTGAS